MKKIISFLLMLTTVVCVFSQTLPTGLVSLLPSGVTANIDDTRKATQLKNLVVAGEKSKGYQAFFAATDAANGEELWVTDGTPAGTRLVKDINPGTAGSDISWLTRFNDKVVFGANDGENGNEVWISDGTAAGTYMVKDIHELAGSEPRGFTQVNETQFIFGAKDFESENYSSRGAQWWLYVSDGTSAGTQLIYQCDTRFPGQDNTSWVSPYCRVGRKVFFKADNINGTVGEELWVTDGTAAGTKFIKDINTESIATGTANSAIDGMINFYNEKLFFKAFSIESSNEPWESDGTPEGTYEIYDSNPTFDGTGFPRGGGASDAGTKPYNGKVYFRGWTMEAGCELGTSNLEGNDFTVFDINQNVPSVDNHSYPDPGVEFDGVYMFCAASGFDATKSNNYGGELWYTDGTTVTMQSDMEPGALSNWVKELTVVSGSLYWWNESGENPEHKQKLFRIDSKTQFPVRVTNLNADGDRINTLRNLGGDLIFQTSSDHQLYCYHYRKEGFDPAVDTDDLDIEYRTRAEITATHTVTAQKSLTVFPNPVDNILYYSGINGSKEAMVINLMGQTLIKKSSDGKIDVSSLRSGIYFLQIDGCSVKFIKK